MTDTIAHDLITTGGTIGVLLLGFLRSEYRNRKASQERKSASGKLDHITVLTNSTLSAANARIEQLEAVVNKLVAERDDPTRGV